MSFLAMSAVGVLPADQRLKRGEVLLQYTRVLQPPDYTPIPFHKQQVKTMKADLTWTFTKLMKKVHRHDAGDKGSASNPPPQHLHELLWEVGQAEAREKAQVAALKQAFMDRFTGVKGLSRFGHESGKKHIIAVDNDDDDEAGGDDGFGNTSAADTSDYVTETEYEQTDGEDELPPPPPEPPAQPAPEEEDDAEVPEEQQGEGEEEEDPGQPGSPMPAAHQQPAEEKQADEAQPAEAAVLEGRDEHADAAAQQLEDAPADAAVQPPAVAVDDDAAGSPEANLVSPATEADATGIRPGHSVLAAVHAINNASEGDEVAAAAAAQRRRSLLRPSRGPSQDFGASGHNLEVSEPLPAGALGRKKSWVVGASTAQHDLAAAFMGGGSRRGSIGSRRGSVDASAAQEAAVAAAAEAASAAEAEAAAAASADFEAAHDEQPASDQQQQQQQQEAEDAAASAAAAAESEDTVAPRVASRSSQRQAVQRSRPSSALAASAATAAAEAEPVPAADPVAADSSSYLLGSSGSLAGDFHDFAAIRDAQARGGGGGGFIPAQPPAAEDIDDGTSAPVFIKSSVLVSPDPAEDEVAEAARDAAVRAAESVEREPPRPYGFLPFVKVTRNGTTREVRIPHAGDKYLDPPLSWLREKYRFAAPAGIHALVTLHAYGYRIYAKNNVKF